MTSERILLVGTYTRPEVHVPDACGEGIVTCAFDPANGHIERRTAFTGIPNPSYLAFDPENRHVLAASENIRSEGSVWQFSCAADGMLEPIFRQNSHGRATCHVAVLPNRQVAAAAYFGGCLAVFPIENGVLSAASRVFHYQGTGPNSTRQEASHAHQTVVSPDARWFYVCDLGADRVWQHDIRAIEDPLGHPMPPGLGPRHLVFHPELPLAYVLGELTGSVAVCRWDTGNGTLSVVTSTPDVEKDASAAAIRIHPSARTLWISLRKHPALRVYQIDTAGTPGTSADVPLPAGEPRDFIISPDGRWLLTATQQGNEIVVIGLDPATGLPDNTPHRPFSINTPVCLILAPDKP
ncbi:MAG: lactonase family protein [Verrucomicrobia bacterium]|nr:lactonase family protein [Verrucomicrobiota bacterium]